MSHEVLPDGLTSNSDSTSDITDRIETLIGDEELDYLGEFHQATLDGESRSSSGESRRTSGTFYTPRELTRFVVDQTLGRMLYGTRNGRPEGEPIDGREPMAPAEAAGLRILDPAAGTGAFLREACRALCVYYEKEGLPDASDAGGPAELAVRQLYGVDLDERAVDFARLNLLFDCADRGADLERCGPALASNLVWANALLFEEWPEGSAPGEVELDFDGRRPCRWGEVFADVFAEAGGFDVVIGNPPWVSYGLRDAGTLEEAEKDYLRAQFDAAEYKLPLYPLFMELGLRLVRPGGLTGFVVPDSFLVGSRFSKIRELLVDRHALGMVALLPDGLWAEGTSGRTVVYRAARSESSAEGVTLRSLDGPAPTDGGSRRRVARSVLEEAPGHRIEIFGDEAVARLVERMRSAEATVADVAELYSGCIARYGQASIVREERCAGHVIRDRSGEIVVDDKDAQSKWRPLVSSGRLVEAFERAPADKFIYVHPDIDVRRRYFKSGHDLARYRGPKLLMRQTGDAPVAAWDESGAFCLNNLHVINAREGVEEAVLRALLGVLNSRPMQLFYQAITMERGRAMAQTDIETIERLPIPAPEEAAGVLGPLVGRIVAGDGEAERLVEEIDGAVCELYGIAPETVERCGEAVR